MSLFQSELEFVTGKPLLFYYVWRGEMLLKTGFECCVMSFESACHMPHNSQLITNLRLA